ncbi:hypothetical protein [Flavobacterium sp.]|uniref:hypothetical protein n=1 Tax=Flavobacterium sp. TaxID=239 RepID=UPI00375024B1
MLKNEYVQLIVRIKEANRQYCASEITKDEALVIFDDLLDTYIKLNQECSELHTKYQLVVQN